MDAFGLHVTIDAKECNRNKLTDNKFIYGLLDKLPSLLSMTKMTLPYVVEWKDKWSNTPGISGFVMIAESHISVHTFPEQNYAFFDIFSCKYFDEEKAIKYIIERIEAKKVDKHTIERGKDFVRPDDK